MRVRAIAVGTLIAQLVSAAAFAEAGLDRCVDAPNADERIKACTEVIEAGALTDGQMFEALAQRGSGYCTDNRYRHAFPDLDEAIQLDPDNHLALWTRAMTFKFTSQHDKSIADLDAALRLKPDDAETFVNRGGALCGGGLFDRAIEIYPDFAEAHFFRAVVYRDMKEHDFATRDLRKAHELEPRNPVCRQAMKDRGYLD